MAASHNLLALKVALVRVVVHNLLVLKVLDTAAHRNLQERRVALAMAVCHSLGPNAPAHSHWMDLVPSADTDCHYHNQVAVHLHSWAYRARNRSCLVLLELDRRGLLFHILFVGSLLFLDLASLESS